MRYGYGPRGPVTAGWVRLLSLVVGVWVGLLFSPAAFATPPDWIELTLPSGLPASDPALDRIAVRYYPATVPGKAPAVIAIPPVGSGERSPMMRRLAETLARSGIACAVVALPYHGSRQVEGVRPEFRFTGGDIPGLARVYRQSAADVGEVASWLQDRPEIDRRKIGVLGISLGAIVAHLAMGTDPRLSVGVAALGGGDLPDLFRSSVLAQLLRLLRPQRVSARELNLLHVVDPLTYADRNRPRNVLMIQAARDMVVPQEDAEQLWEALGEPPIVWMDANHFALAVAEARLVQTAIAYYRSVWNGEASPPAKLPRVYVPTLKGGLLVRDRDGVSPAVQWQFHTFAKRPDHISLVHANLGVGDFRPFVSLAATLHPSVDVGLSQPLSGGKSQVYLSVHLVY